MTPVGVFFICQNEDKCHFVNSANLTRTFRTEYQPPTSGITEQEIRNGFLLFFCPK